MDICETHLEEWPEDHMFFPYAKRDFMSEVELYLTEHGGDLLNFKLHMAQGFSAGTSFLSALSTWDIYTVRNEGLYEQIRTKSRIDDPLLLETVAFLKEQS